MEDMNPGNAIANAALGPAVAPVPATRATRPGRQKPRKAPAKMASADKTPNADAKSNKTELVLKRLRSTKGTTITALMEVTGWQAHSVRGFLSAIVRKKLGLDLTSEIGKDGQRRYRIAEGSSGPA